MGGSIGGCSCSYGTSAQGYAPVATGAFGAPQPADLGGPFTGDPHFKRKDLVAPGHFKPGMVMHGVRQFARSAPEDQARAGALYASAQSNAQRWANLQDAQRDGFKVLKHGNTIHVRSDRFSRDGHLADPSRPEMLMYRRDPRVAGGYRLIAMVFTSQQSIGPVDMGMGAPHVHPDSTRFMQHIWLNGHGLHDAFGMHEPH
jgi:hypothetical protein